MTVVCRMLELPPDRAAAVTSQPGTLPEAMKAAKVYSDVYRYWHAIQYLLAHLSPDSAAARWLTLGQAVSSASGEVPSARIIPPPVVVELDAALRGIEPEDLIPHYDAAALDGAAIYPRTWQEWEETFDPLGQVLEHYAFLQRFARNCAAAGNALLLYFEESDS
jgi:hypothetical protein